MNERRQDKIIAVETFSKEVSVTAEKIFSPIIEMCGPLLNQIFSVTSDTTTLNTGKKAA